MLKTVSSFITLHQPTSETTTLSMQYALSPSWQSRMRRQRCPLGRWVAGGSLKANGWCTGDSSTNPLGLLEAATSKNSRGHAPADPTHDNLYTWEKAQNCRVPPHTVIDLETCPTIGLAIHAKRVTLPWPTHQCTPQAHACSLRFGGSQLHICTYSVVHSSTHSDRSDAASWARRCV